MSLRKAWEAHCVKNKINVGGHGEFAEFLDSQESSGSTDKTARKRIKDNKKEQAGQIEKLSARIEDIAARMDKAAA